MRMWWLFTLLFASFRCCFFGLVPIPSRLWGSVRLRPFVFIMDSIFFLKGSQARWPYPRNHFYLCLLVVRSIAMLRYLSLVYHASHITMSASNLVTLPSKPLLGYVTASLSPSYSVASCRWRLEAVPCWNIYLLVGISLYCRVILMHLYTW